MARAMRYVDDLIRQFAGVVAEEHYIQEVAPPKQRRELKSEFLLVKPPGSPDWYQFRDVIEVDGRPVHDRQDRLTQLFATPTTDALKRAAQVTQESARYNVTNFGTLNKPLTVLSFLQSQYRARFRFSPGRIDTKVGPTARLVQFRELRVPTLLLRNGFPNLLASGRLWIDEQSGGVLQTQLLVDSGDRNEVVTTFEFDSDLRVYAPVQMRERYDRRSDVVTGVATYSHFRRYQVQTEEHLR